MDEIGLYVHFPWCLQKCPYCDFLSIAAPSPEPGRPATRAEATARLPHGAYADAVITELRARADRLRQDRPVLRSVFFGGGTPSLWDPRELTRVLTAVKCEFTLHPELEVTVECNPTSVDENHFEVLADGGVSRVSIGVQALDQARLTFLGRLHDSAGALHAVETAVRSSVPRVSADLIFGVYDQSPDDAARDVNRVLDTGVTHLSAYALTIEESTRFGALDRAGKLPLLSDALVAESFEAVSATVEARGLRHYEVSNFALPGHESVHNVGYWRGRDYLGVGVGAYGTVSLPGGRLRYKNLLASERYLAAWSKAPEFDPFETHLSEREAIDGATGVKEALLLGLRLRGGISPEETSARFGAPFWTASRRAAADRLIARGRLTETSEGGTSHLSIPREHWLFADGVIRDLL